MLQQVRKTPDAPHPLQSTASQSATAPAHSPSGQQAPHATQQLEAPAQAAPQSAQPRRLSLRLAVTHHTWTMPIGEPLLLLLLQAVFLFKPTFGAFHCSCGNSEGAAFAEPPVLLQVQQILGHFLLWPQE
jgi:hypothetical protein